VARGEAPSAALQLRGLELLHQIDAGAFDVGPHDDRLVVHRYAAARFADFNIKHLTDKYLAPGGALERWHHDATLVDIGAPGHWDGQYVVSNSAARRLHNADHRADG
jgi:hypothetical protein